MEHRTDVAIVGAGILGLAHAYEAARKGLKVVVFERDLHAEPCPWILGESKAAAPRLA